MHAKISAKRLNSKIDASPRRKFTQRSVSREFEIKSGKQSTGKQTNLRRSTVKNAIDRLFSFSLRSKRCLKTVDYIEKFSSDEDFESPKEKKIRILKKVTKQEHLKKQHGSPLKTNQDKIASRPSSDGSTASSYDPSDLSCDQWVLIKPKLPYSGQKYSGRSVDEVSKRLRDTSMSIQLKARHKRIHFISRAVFLKRNLKLGEKTVQRFLNENISIKIHGQQQHEDSPKRSTLAQEVSQDTTDEEKKCAEKSKQNTSVSGIAIAVGESMATANAPLKEDVLLNISDNDPCSVENDTNIQPEHSCQRQHVSELEGQQILKVALDIRSSALDPSKCSTHAEQLNNNALLSRKNLLSRKMKNVSPPNLDVLKTSTGTTLDCDVKQTLDELPKDSEIADTVIQNETSNNSSRLRKRPNDSGLSGDQSFHGKHLNPDNSIRGAIDFQTPDNTQSAKRYKLRSHTELDAQPQSSSISIQSIKSLYGLPKNMSPLKQSVPVDYILANEDDSPILQNNGSKMDTQENGDDEADAISASRQVKVNSTSHFQDEDEAFSLSQQPIVAGPFRSLFFRAIDSRRSTMWSFVNEN
ncbi:uncharacterized protein LOC133345914 [Lethenteron reissneri]|uniref:uncharacterized protein LOC133345914 n=1 Tax=Lethenteron reissneri TaxID=7753 RepID=UPI002AB75786|nr:uncharacterized protein LOC133345914 [Lethenteron reissneri]